MVESSQGWVSGSGTYFCVLLKSFTHSVYLRHDLQRSEIRDFFRMFMCVFVSVCVSACVVGIMSVASHWWRGSCCGRLPAP